MKKSICINPSYLLSLHTYVRALLILAEYNFYYKASICSMVRPVMSAI